ncbi:hypothetical protein B2G71_13605 [Novosphingobium sp. PC22D]|uniref:hypothetical protein n=1 Tax=Novosphingobium sp. PC22D TaxID=1962403 RepID=UPI000BF047DE|nr:hypothetical protein [Novosphingobium sp. PC22D]PEQ12237.1 hypothetical protein B2G71_13605 [Novosphingobium sp. PC22D]
MGHTGTASLTISELREFASFNASEQRYIKCSLDVGLGRQDAVKLWARDGDEVAAIRAQYAAYEDLRALRSMIPDSDDYDGVETFMGKLVRVSAFDLSQNKLASFSAYRFLYERLLGASVRQWLPGAFCGAAALPLIRPDRRKLLLHSISEAAATAPGWSDREPSFFPEWIEKEAA